MKPTHSIVVIWVKKFRTELMVEIFIYLCYFIRLLPDLPEVQNYIEKIDTI